MGFPARQQMDACSTASCSTTRTLGMLRCMVGSVVDGMWRGARKGTRAKACSMGQLKGGKLPPAASVISRNLLTGSHSHLPHRRQPHTPSFHLDSLSLGTLKAMHLLPDMDKISACPSSGSGTKRYGSWDISPGPQLNPLDNNNQLFHNLIPSLIVRIFDHNDRCIGRAGLGGLQQDRHGIHTRMQRILLADYPRRRFRVLWVLNSA